MIEFDPFMPLLGGLLIGLSAAMLMLSHGQIAGISGLVGGMLTKSPTRPGMRLSFVMGLASAGLILGFLRPALFPVEMVRPIGWIIVAGLVVGFGTRMGCGCTSGHGICGLSRASGRSLVATMAFMVTGILTVTLLRILGGA